jgi:hypothetical protein
METQTEGHFRTDNPPRSFQIWYYTIENPRRKSVLLEGDRGGGSLLQEVWPSVEREREREREKKKKSREGRDFYLGWFVRFLGFSRRWRSI